MTDGTTTIETPTTPTTETPLANDPAARTETGEIIDRSKPTEPAGNPAEPTKPESAVGAPEAYADFSIPEGHTLDTATIESATPIFRELGLSQDQAQKLVDFYSAKIGEINSQNEGFMEQMRTEWRNQLSADKEIGGKLDAVKVDIGRALDRIPAEVRTAYKEAMDLTGAGDNPAIIKAMYSLAQLVNEGTPVRGDNPSPHGQSRTGVETRPSAASAMYPNLPKR
jgi:hypothetical protein